MIKPNGYEEVSTGDFTPIELGGHHAIIKNVKEQQAQSGKNMVVVAIDFAPNDKQAGYFMTQFNNDIRPDKKYPYQAVQYIVVEDANGNCSKSFKSFITSFEKSNNVQATWGNDFANQFKNKKIGVVYGNVEEEYNGEIKMRRRIRWFCDDATADTAKIPDDRLLNKQAPLADVNQFVNVPVGANDEIPF